MRACIFHLRLWISLPAKIRVDGCWGCWDPRAVSSVPNSWGWAVFRGACAPRRVFRKVLPRLLPNSFLGTKGMCCMAACGSHPVLPTLLPLGTLGTVLQG